MYSYYGKLSTEVYDLSKPIGYSFGDIEYYMKRLRSVKGRILEPAVGTGRVLIPLLEAGLEVDGIDISPDMLALCRSYCAKRGFQPNLYEGDITTLTLPQTYEAIILPAGSFLLIQERQKALEALRRFYQHLADGGRLLIDIFLQTDLELGKVSTRTWTSAEGDLLTLESKMVEVNLIQQYTVSHHRYERWRDQQLVQTELERFSLNWYGIEEFKLMLESVGFTDVVISADYEYQTYPVNPHQSVTFEAVRRVKL
jgi:ubiquinone/menaquinone biosynthesis C-methylase UbiE